MLEEPKRASGFGLALEDVDDHAGRVPDLDGTPVACLDKHDAIEPIEDDDGRVLRDGVNRIADGEDEPLLVGEGLHACSPSMGCGRPTDDSPKGRYRNHPRLGRGRLFGLDQARVIGQRHIARDSGPSVGGWLLPVPRGDRSIVSASVRRRMLPELAARGRI